MIEKIVSASLANRILVLVLTLALGAVGVFSFKRLPIEAYPDIADTWVQVITQWPGHAAEEIERQLTVPIEVLMNGVPHHTHLRSTSLFGLSSVTMIFDEQTAPFQARLLVNEALGQVNLPPGVQPALGAMASPVGQILFYTLDAPGKTSRELKELQDWELERQWRQLPGVADVVSFGGEVKQYQVMLNPLALNNYGLSPGAVSQALQSNNQNSGGGFLVRGDETINVRGIGKVESVTDIANVVITEKGGTPVRVGQVGQVSVGAQPRLGKIIAADRGADGGIRTREDVVEGIVLARVGEVEEDVLEGVHAKLKSLNAQYRAMGVELKTYLDRSELIHLTSRTVEENLIVGMILVLAVLCFFLGNLRAALIVATTIPLSLLFASILLDLRHIPANLLSLGALDFGMVVDGAVVMVENIFRHKEERRRRGLDPATENIVELVRVAAREVERPIVYAVLIIILAYLPIFLLQRIEGKLFSPMAWTVAFALLGSLLLVLTVVPVLATYFMRGDMHEWHNPVIHWLERNYRIALTKAIHHRRLVLSLGVASFVLAMALAFGGAIGSEFLPHLDEGDVWLRGTLPPSASLELADTVVHRARALLMTYPEVPETVCQMGRPDDGADATGFFNTECFVKLRPRSEWRKEYQTKEKLIDAMDRDLQKIPGVIWNFSQPISDNVEEMMSGVKGELVAKIFGEDLTVLMAKAGAVRDVLTTIPGVRDPGVFSELGQPNVNIAIDRDRISRYGLNISDVQDVIETAVGGKAASQIVSGEKRFDIVVRYQPQFRDRVEALRRLLITTPENYKLPLEELAEITVKEGASMIYRENNRRYAVVKFSVRDRDLGGTIADARAAVARAVTLPPGYELTWAGEFESQQRAEARLAMVIPLTVLAIFAVLYMVFGSLKWSALIMTNILFARLGGVLALFVTGTNFSVSSGIGFLAVFGVSIQTGVLLVSYINQLRLKGMGLNEAVVEGSCQRLRPIMMTALVATFGLLPAAFSHAIGSDSQRPMAIVIVGGLVMDLVVAFFLIPTLYLVFARDHDFGPRGEART